MALRKFTITGLNAHDSIMLKAAVDTASGFATGLWEYTPGLSDAQLVFFDADNPQAKAAIQQLKELENGPLLVSCSSSNHQDLISAHFALLPPFIYKNVLPVLRQADALAGTPVGEAASVQGRQTVQPAATDRTNSDKNRPATSSQKTINTVTPSVPQGADYKLCHLIDEIIAANKSVEISHPDYPSIRICSEKHWFIFAGDLSKYSKLFRTEVSEFTAIELGDEIRKHAFSGHFPRAIWELVYAATLLGSDGKLMPPMSMNDRLFLIRPPEFEMVPHNEKHIAIADYMRSHSASVKEIASNRGIELETVIAFCNACQAIDLLIVSGEPANRLSRLISKIVDLKKSVEIYHPDYPLISICAEKDWFIFSEDLKKHDKLFSIDLDEFSVEERGDEIRKKAFSGSFPKALWELVYIATMHATEGKLFRPLQAHDQLHLKKKPDFEYVPHTDQHIILAEYMVHYSDTLPVIAENTGVNIQTVIDFCNMCQSINLIERNSDTFFPFAITEESPTIESAIEHPQPSPKPGFISALMTNLGKKV